MHTLLLTMPTNNLIKSSSLENRLRFKLPNHVNSNLKFLKLKKEI